MAFKTLAACGGIRGVDDTSSFVSGLSSVGHVQYICTIGIGIEPVNSEL
jgi:hypothetical protein